MRPWEAPPGTRDEVQSGRDAAMMHAVYDPIARAAIARQLADAFLTAPWRAESVAESGAARLNGWPPWLEGLALSVLAVFPVAPLGDRQGLARTINEFLEAHSAGAPELQPGIRVGVLVRPRRWPVAEITSAAMLAEQLELSDGQLAWLADVRSWERTVRDEKLRNYRYRAVPRRGGLPRVIEVPKARLKEVQRWVLREILDQVPPHGSAHGFTRGRSAISHARWHVGQAVVLRLDLRDFFASIAAGRVYGLFRALGYAPSIARLLTGVTTNVVPAGVWQVIARRADDPRLVQPRFWLGRALATPHLPQGAPTSPSLANLLAFRLDRRLSGLAAAAGVRYSRYADDLTFSGTGRLRRGATKFTALVDEIVRDEGFALNVDKSQLRPSCARQTVCGIVVNDHLNVARDEYDTLKAILHNVLRHGAAAENRTGVPDFEAHVRGRIAWVSALHPERGAKLRRRLEAIDWST